VEPTLALEHLSKQFGPLRAVDDVSLRVHPGEVVGLLGPNGAGKTTALRMLAGLISPTTGRACVSGIDVTAQPLEARRKLGFLTASTGLYARLTPREVMRTFGQLHGMSPEQIAQRTKAVVELLALEEFVDRRCGTLSSGQKQRASIARAIVHGPEAYVLDEPTSTLDPLAAKAILELVQRVRAEGKAVLFSTHRMEEADFLCDRIVFLRQGRVVAEGTPTQLRERSGQASLTAAFLHYAGADGVSGRSAA
jgi:sodium transport system ATP-binding protein